MKKISDDQVPRKIHSKAIDIVKYFNGNINVAKCCSSWNANVSCIIYHVLKCAAPYLY